jgi:proton-translocating NAD(P)+ transhydrogenase subunit beta
MTARSRVEVKPIRCGRPAGGQKTIGAYPPLKPLSSLVGASGIILTGIMCRAMNRSPANVLCGGVGVEVAAGAAADAVYAGRVKSASADEIAMVLESARRVVVVPGYGMAVAQAQHAVWDLARHLESRGTEVEFGIHPMAGRMPGHVNVLLAEADVPYEKMKEMADVNPIFVETDVVIVIGANDVVNPLARTDPKSPIAGMPILDATRRAPWSSSSGA